MPPWHGIRGHGKMRLLMRHKIAAVQHSNRQLQKFHLDVLQPQSGCKKYNPLDYSLVFRSFISGLPSLLAATRSAKGKTPSSSKWLRRQRKDPLVAQAAMEHYRSRSAYKLIELDDKHHFLKKGSVVIDLGARPGSWSQVAANRVGTDKLSEEELATWRQGMVLAVDLEGFKQQLLHVSKAYCVSEHTGRLLFQTTHRETISVQYLGHYLLAASLKWLELASIGIVSDAKDTEKAMVELPGVVVMAKCDITCPHVHQQINHFMEDRKADVIMSDMAPNATGMHELDHQRIMALCQSAYTLARNTLRPGGVFFCKLWQGSLTNSFKLELKGCFEMVKECRLKTTRKESSEIYIFAKDYTVT